MFYNTCHILTTLIGALPTDSIHWTGRDRVIDIMSLVGIELVDARESVVIEIENVARDSSTGTTTNTSRVHVWLSEFWELIRVQEGHRKMISNK
jgi:hypothetical protein